MNLINISQGVDFSDIFDEMLKMYMNNTKGKTEDYNYFGATHCPYFNPVKMKKYDIFKKHGTGIPMIQVTPINKDNFYIFAMNNYIELWLQFYNICGQIRRRIEIEEKVSKKHCKFIFIYSPVVDVVPSNVTFVKQYLKKVGTEMQHDKIQLGGKRG